MSRDVLHFARQLVMVLAPMAIFTLPAAAQCPPCIKDMTPMAGHGPRSSTDNRRVINIKISSSWDASPGTTNPVIWNALQCAANQWNTTTDGSGHTVGYYFQVNQTTSTPDITIVQQTPTAGAGYTQIEPSDPVGGPYVVFVAKANTGRQPIDICGSLTHEIGHLIGLGEKNTSFCTDSNQTIMDGTFADGTNAINNIQPADVAQSNMNLNPTTRTSCQETVSQMGSSGQETVPDTCSGPAPSTDCNCVHGSWSCPSCPGPAPNSTCSCNALGQWDCACVGVPETCPDGSEAVCYNNQWDCGSVTTSSCVGTEPTCSDGSLATCDGNQWTCPPPPPCTDVCDPSCPDYDPSDPSCGGCDPSVDPSCGGCDPSVDPSCGGGGGGGGCDTDCCMSINPCDVACSVVPLSQRQFWNSPGMTSLQLKHPKPVNAVNPQCAVLAPTRVILASSKTVTAAVKEPNPLPLMAAERVDLSPTVFAQLANDSPAQGSATAPITIVEFSDFECPFCKAMAATLSQQVLPAEGGNLRLVFKYFPLRFHPWAQQAAEIGECVRKQDETAFWQLHDFFFEQQRSLNSDNVEQEALSLFSHNPRVHLDQLKKCVEKHESRPDVMKAILQGEQNGVHGTPTLFINGIRVSGAQSAAHILKAIEQAKTNPKPTTDAEVDKSTTPAWNPNAIHLPCDKLAIEGGNPCLF